MLGRTYSAAPSRGHQPPPARHHMPLQPHASMPSSNDAGSYHHQAPRKAPGAHEIHAEVSKQFEEEIQVLSEYRQITQEKFFRRWMNYKYGLKIRDLFEDLQDGRVLLKFLEIQSGEVLGVPKEPKFKVQKLDNLHRAISYLRNEMDIKLVNIGAEDIYDGNRKAILGLIWTTIIQFQISPVLKQGEAAELLGKSTSAQLGAAPGGKHDPRKRDEINRAEEALLLWCKLKTDAYPGVEVTNFSNSWRDGLAFNALIHAYAPEIVDIQELQPGNNRENLDKAFTAAEKLGVPRLLDIEDVDFPNPDKHIILPYVASLYQAFCELNKERLGGKRIGRIMDQIMRHDKGSQAYEESVQSLFAWIDEKIAELQKTPSSTEDIQELLTDFKEYRLTEKPPKYNERCGIESDFFKLQTAARANDMRVYKPPEGLNTVDIEARWNALERAEHDHETILRDWLHQQERLDKFVEKFFCRAQIRETWLRDMSLNVKADPLKLTPANCEAVKQQYEALATQIAGKDERFSILQDMCDKLIELEYSDSANVQATMEDLAKWYATLNEEVGSRRQYVNNYVRINELANQVLNIEEEFDILGQQCEEAVPVDGSMELMDIQDLLERHVLNQTQLESNRAVLNRFAEELEQLSPVAAEIPERVAAVELLNRVDNKYLVIKRAMEERHRELDAIAVFHQYLSDVTEEKAWVNDRTVFMSSSNLGKDLAAVHVLLRKHEAAENEIADRIPKIEELLTSGDQLLRAPVPRQTSEEILRASRDLSKAVDSLQRVTKARRQLIDDAVEAHQFYTDAAECQSWMDDREQLLSSTDFGEDENSARAHLRLSKKIRDEVGAYNAEVDKLADVATIMTRSFEDHKLNPLLVTLQRQGHSRGEEVRTESPDVDEILEEIRNIEQVRMTHAYTGKPTNDGQPPFSVAKGQTLDLLEKSTKEWYKVADPASGRVGYVPANRVKILEETRQEVVRQRTPSRKSSAKKPGRVRRVPSLRGSDNLHFDKERIERKITDVVGQYEGLVEMADHRCQALDDVAEFFGFCSKCKDLEEWIVKTRATLTKRGQPGDPEQLQRTMKDLSAQFQFMSNRYHELKSLATRLVELKHPDELEVIRRYNEISNLWESLYEIQSKIERKLESATVLERYDESCNEAAGLIDNRLAAWDSVEEALRQSPSAMERQKQLLARDLGIVRDKVAKTDQLARAVTAKFPDEAQRVANQQEGLERKLTVLETHSQAWNDAAANKANLEKFFVDSKDALQWLERSNATLDNAKNDPLDERINIFLDMNAELQSEKKRFIDITRAGQKIVYDDPSQTRVRSTIDQMDRERDALAKRLRAWEDDMKREQMLDFFEKQARQVDCVLAEQEAFLQVIPIGSSVDDVEALIKNHEEFTSKSRSQDEKLTTLRDTADKIVKADHPESQRVADRATTCMSRRENIKGQMKSRSNTLQDALKAHQYLNEASEFVDLIDDKLSAFPDNISETVVSDGDVDKAKRKQELLEAWNTANVGRYNRLLNQGDELVDIHTVVFETSQLQASTTPKSARKNGPAVKRSASFSRDNSMQDMADNERVLIQKLNEALQELKAKWNELKVRADNRRADLNHSSKSSKLHGMLSVADERLLELERRIRENEQAKPGDLHSAKQLQQMNQVLEKQIEEDCEFLDSLTRDEMIQSTKAAPLNASAGHFDQENRVLEHQVGPDGRSVAVETPIQRSFAASEQLQARNRTMADSLGGLKNRATKVQDKLNQSVTFHDLMLQLDMQERWIDERMPRATSEETGNDLFEAQKLMSRHQNVAMEIVGHKGNLAKLREKCQGFIDNDSGQFDVDALRKKLSGVDEHWTLLNDKADARKKLLEENLAIHQCLFDISEVEIWLQEAQPKLRSKDCGRDSRSADSLLYKHQNFQKEMSIQAKELGAIHQSAQKLMHSELNGASEISSRLSAVENDLVQAQKLADTRQKELEIWRLMYLYIDEVNDLSAWITVQMPKAASDDYGEDYEKLCRLKTQFESFVQSVEANEERFQECAELADDLAVKMDSIDAPDSKKLVLDKRAELKESWLALREQMDARTINLDAAARIHQFHHDLDDLLSLMQEKSVELESHADDIGRDRSSLNALLRRHTNLANEINSFATKTEVLEKTGTQLAQDFPGENADSIIASLGIMNDTYKTLLASLDARRIKLEGADRLHTFFVSASHVLSTLAEMNGEISHMLQQKMTGTTPQELRSVETQIVDHDDFKTRVSAFETTKKQMEQTGQELLDESHFASPEIRDRLDACDRACTQLAELIQRRETILTDRSDLFAFVRDADWIHENYNSVNQRLDALAETSSIENITNASSRRVEQEMDRANNIANTITHLRERMGNLADMADALVQREHPQSQEVAARMEDLLAINTEVHYKVKARQTALQNRYMSDEYLDDAAQFGEWIENHISALEEAAKPVEAEEPLEKRVRRLQKVQAVDSEVTSNKPKYADLEERAVEVSALWPDNSDRKKRIDSQASQLARRWKVLVDQLTDQRQALADAKHVLRFNYLAEQIERSLQEKQMLVAADELGDDYEHCVALLKRVDDTEKLAVDGELWQELINLHKLLHGSFAEQYANDKMEDVNDKWGHLQKSLQNYRAKLADARQVHEWLMKAEQFKDQLNEMSEVMTTSECGDTLRATDTLLAKHKNTVISVNSVKPKVDELLKEYPELTPNTSPPRERSTIPPSFLPEMKKKHEELSEALKTSDRLTDARMKQLQRAHDMHKLRDDSDKLCSFCDATVNSLTLLAEDSYLTPDDSGHALDRHAQFGRDTEIRKPDYEEVLRKCSSLSQSSETDDDQAVLRTCKNMLKERWSTLETCIDETKSNLTCVHDWLTFERLDAQVTNWLQEKLTIATNPDVGDTLSSTQRLINEHMNLTKAMTNYSKLEDHDALVDKIANATQRHPEADEELPKKVENLTALRNELATALDNRSKVLQHKLAYLEYTRDVFELSGWIEEKLAIATDEAAWRELTNLSTKLQRHADFESELKQNATWLDGILENEADLVAAVSEQVAQEISQQNSELADLWRRLQEASTEKRRQLELGQVAATCLQDLDALERWYDETESRLSREDCAPHYSGVEVQLKRHEQLVRDVGVRQARLETIRVETKTLLDQEHVYASTVEERLEEVAAKYADLIEPMSARKANLADTMALYQLYRDINRENQWIADKLPFAQSQDYGDSYSSVMNLVKKQEALNQEVERHAGEVTGIQERVDRMTSCQHFQSDEMQKRYSQLASALRDLQKACESRSEMLKEAEDSHQFYNELNEASEWLAEKRLQVVHVDDQIDSDAPTQNGGVDADTKSETGSEILARTIQKLEIGLDRLRSLQHDLQAFETTVESLKRLGDSLIDRKHFESKNIRSESLRLDTNYDEVLELVKQSLETALQRQKLCTALVIYSDIVDWLESVVQASSLNLCGVDLDACEKLTKEHDELMEELSSGHTRVTDLLTALSELSAMSTHSNVLEDKHRVLDDLYKAAVTATEERKDMLLGAHQVHTFTRDVTFTSLWISEKEPNIFNNDKGHDLESSRKLLSKHVALQHDLQALNNKMEGLHAHAKKLSDLYPDVADVILEHYTDVSDRWAKLVAGWRARRKDLEAAVQLQTFYMEFRHITSWISQTLSSITSASPDRDLASLETISERHKQFKGEIDAFNENTIASFKQVGQFLLSLEEMADLHSELKDKSKTVDDALATLKRTWASRKKTYDQLEDALKFEREMNELEKWLAENEIFVNVDDENNDAGPKSMEESEKMLEKQAQVEKMLALYEERFKALGKSRSWEAAQQREMEEREKEAQEKARLDQIRKDDHKRAVEARRQRRITQEVTPAQYAAAMSLGTPSGSRVDLSGTVVGPPIDAQGSPRLSTSQMSGDTSREALNASGATPQQLAFRPKGTTRPSSMLGVNNPAPVEMEGMLQRKQTALRNNQRAPTRTWRTVYCVLSGQLLSFAKSKQDWDSMIFAGPGLPLRGARCEIAQDYVKKENVFRLLLPDGAEFLFYTSDRVRTLEWINKLNHYAKLDPKQQLESYDEKNGIPLPAARRSRDADLFGATTLPAPAVPSSSPPRNSENTSFEPEIQRSSVAKQQASATPPPALPKIGAPRNSINVFDEPTVHHANRSTSGYFSSMGYQPIRSAPTPARRPFSPSQDPNKTPSSQTTTTIHSRSLFYQKVESTVSWETPIAANRRSLQPLPIGDSSGMHQHRLSPPTRDESAHQDRPPQQRTSYPMYDPARSVVTRPMVEAHRYAIPGNASTIPAPIHQVPQYEVPQQQYRSSTMSYNPSSFNPQQQHYQQRQPQYYSQPSHHYHHQTNPQPLSPVTGASLIRGGVVARPPPAPTDRNGFHGGDQSGPPPVAQTGGPLPRGPPPQRLSGRQQGRKPMGPTTPPNQPIFQGGGSQRGIDTLTTPIGESYQPPHMDPYQQQQYAPPLYQNMPPSSKVHSTGSLPHPKRSKKDKPQQRSSFKSIFSSKS